MIFNKTRAIFWELGSDAVSHDLKANYEQYTECKYFYITNINKQKTYKYILNMEIFSVSVEQWSGNVQFQSVLSTTTPCLEAWLEDMRLWLEAS